MTKWVDQLELLDAVKDSDRSGRLVFRFPVVKEHLQGFDTYAGGAQAAAHDLCTAWTILVISKPEYWPNFGATRTLNMSYFKPAKEGDVLLVKTQVSALMRLSRADSTIMALTWNNT
jgi:acyl-coenzyme A thioesterase 13